MTRSSTETIDAQKRIATRRLAADGTSAGRNAGVAVPATAKRCRTSLLTVNRSRRIRRLRRRSLGQYRYVRLRWRATFAVVDLLGTVVFTAARALRRWLTGGTTTSPSPQHEPKVILLVQLDHLGDAIISTAMLPALRAQYPKASIEVLAGAWNREVFQALPEVDHVHVSRVNRFARTGLARLAWIPATFYWGLILRRRKVDLGIDVRGEFPVALILWLCGARRRLGWASGGGGFLLTDHAGFVAGRPEVESRAALLAALGIHPSTANALRPSFRPTAAARRRIARELAELSAKEQGWPGSSVSEPPEILEQGWPGLSVSEPPGILRPGGSLRSTPATLRPNLGLPELYASGRLTGPRIVLHVGAGTPAKSWPVEHWQELLGRIIVGHRAQVVLVGTRRDRMIADRILGGRAWPGVADWTGRLSIVELAGLLEQADVLVGADSGPAHLAAALGTPTVVLFSGTNSAGQWRPSGVQVSVIRHKVDCSPCHRERCPRAGHPCMRLLDPRQVAAEVQRVLARTSHAGVPLLDVRQAVRSGPPPHCFCEAVAHCGDGGRRQLGRKRV